MVQGDVVQDCDARSIERNRPVALVHLTDERPALADPRTGESRARGDEVFHIRSVHDRRALSCAMQNPTDHAHRSRLAARTRNSNAPSGSVKEFSEKPRAGCDGGTDTTRGLHVRDCLLDSGGGDQDLIGATHAAAILRMEQHASCTQEIKFLGIAPLVERAVGALYPSSPGLDNQRKGGHAATADAAEKVISKPRHRRKLQALPMRCNARGPLE